MGSIVNETALRDTLSQAGVPDHVAMRYTVLDSSGSDAGGNARVHASTNTKIMNALRDDELGSCIHVTGGARALTDPFHRQICEAMLGEGKDPFRVLYHLPADAFEKPFDVVAHTLSLWKARGFDRWEQRLLTIDMIGRKAVDLKGRADEMGIQYSIFGHRFVQLQAAHKDGANTKAVWLIEAEGIHDFLRENAEGALSGATEVDEDAFKDFNAALHSNIARAMMKRISGQRNIDQDGLLSDERFWMFPESPLDTLEALALMEFITIDPAKCLDLTTAGHDFLSQT